MSNKKKSKIKLSNNYCEWCEISNGRTIPKFVSFLNFDNFPNLKHNLNYKSI